MKIKNFKIKGLRGIRNDLFLELNNQSILLYGDNGSGKSSISDAFEWYYKDEIEHLISEEIDRKGGKTALRNIFLPEDEDAFLDIEFSDTKLNSKKKLFFKRGDLISEHSNSSDEFNSYKDSNENLILRYRDLLKFVLATKDTRLRELSGIIGFSEVIKTRDTLKKVYNKLSNELGPANFDNPINTQQQNLIENLGQNITSDQQFIDSINSLIEPLSIGKKVKQFSDIKDVVALIKRPEDSKIIELYSFYNSVKDFCSNLTAKIKEIEKLYSDYYKNYQEIVSDIERINKIILENLLSEGIKVLKSGIIKEDNCPLCLQSKGKTELLKELEFRIKELEEYKKEKLKLDELKKDLQDELDTLEQEIKVLTYDKHFELDENRIIKENVINVKNLLDKFSNEIGIQIATDKKIKKPEELVSKEDLISKIVNFSTDKIELLKGRVKDDKTDIVVKIEISKKSYSEIKRLEKTKKIIEDHKKSIEITYNEFIKKQKDELQHFIDSFSQEINQYYQFLNPSEKIEDIKLIPIETKDELKGITIQFKFFDKETLPPQKYLSESHLSCFGIVFFLTSVRALNKNSKFFILDDVISSYDTEHKKRLADLLIEKFSDYQIVLMTHEKSWAQYLQNIVKSKNWKTNTIKWNEEKGTYVDEPIKDLLQKIQSRFEENKEDGLGNDLRKYLEHILKKITFNLEVKLKFQYNDTNEDRMAYELLTELKGKINRQISEELKNDLKINRLLGSVFIGNKDSHNGSYTPSMGDLKAVWKDIIELHNLFYCEECQRYVSIKYYDEGNKKIRCKCKSLVYDWKR